MEIHLTPEQTAQLAQIGAYEGKDAARVVEETVSRVLQQRAQFLGGVERGIAAADRGDLIDHEEMVKRIDRLFQP